MMMSRLGFKSVRVYHGESCLGELDTVPIKDKQFQFPNNEIRIHHLSPLSERCPPLSILQTISSFSVRCKLESNSPIEHAQLINLHASCFYELKTAVVLLGDEEVHLVAMPSKLKKFPCFWCCSVPSGLYNSCLAMLNMRCLAIVFDLDETLIVANTMKSFEDRIETLTGWIGRESDPIRVSGMTSELKRYVEDRALLKQFIESDCVVDNGKMFNVQLEEVPLKSAVASFDKVVRPVIRLREKSLVLTRINPEIRDTSVLVRLRPAWEDLKTYLIAKGRKRFEVYVCTMAERDYALEMWRLLDPEAHLINSKQLLERVVCVKSGGRKSLQNVFQDGSCHPRMAMVIDDRLKVWEDKDQPRVHVVPAFTPYYAPQAETANAVPILCVARNVACNVRGGFFKEFDENLLRRIAELFYEDDVLNLPPAPDASNFLMSEDASFVPNSNGNAPIAEGMHGSEVGKRLNQLEEKSIKDSATILNNNGLEMKAEFSQSSVAAPPTIFVPGALKPVAPSDKPSLLGAPFRRDSSFSEADPDFRRRFPMMNHTPDSRYRPSAEPPLIPRLPVQVPVPSIQSQGGWSLDEVNRGRVNNRIPSTVQGSDVLRSDTQRAFHNHNSRGPAAYASSGVQSHVSEVKIEEPYPGFGLQKRSHPPASHQSGPDIGVSQNQSSFNNRESSTDNGKLLLPPSLSIGVLQEIAHRCCSKVEFRSIVSTSEHLQFSVEVLFTGEKIGVGMGKTRKDAQQQAAENALRCLADKYVSYVTSRSGGLNKDSDKLSLGVENGFIWETVVPGSDESLVKDGSKESTHEAAEVTNGLSTNLGNQSVQKRANSPRSLESNPSKRQKQELMHGSQDLSSSRNPKNGHTVL